MSSVVIKSENNTAPYLGTAKEFIELQRRFNRQSIHAMKPLSTKHTAAQPRYHGESHYPMASADR
jgi:hypothetical protein